MRGLGRGGRREGHLRANGGRAEVDLQKARMKGRGGRLGEVEWNFPFYAAGLSDLRYVCMYACLSTYIYRYIRAYSRSNFDNIHI